MSTSNQLILILSALGSINGLALALYLWIIKPKKLANRFLSVMLLMICIRTLKSVLFYFNPDIAKVILQIGLSSCLLIGPLLYFFCLSHLNKINEERVPWWLHLATFVVIIITVGLIYPYQIYPELWGGVFYKVINYIWLFYIVLSIKLVLPKLKAISVQRKLLQEDIWLFTIFIGNALIWLAYYTASYTSYIVGALSFSFILAIIGLLIIFRRSKSTLNEKYVDKKIAGSEADEMIKQLYELMHNEALYTNSLITMPQIAKRLGMPTPRFSQLLNDNLNKSFSTFINELRIEAAKNLLKTERSTKIEVIAEQCGFNSQSTFYSAFKKQTSQTPASFRAENIPKL